MKLYKSYFLAKLMYLTRALVLFAFVNADTNCFMYDDNYSSWNSAGFTDPIGFIKFIQQFCIQVLFPETKLGHYQSLPLGNYEIYFVNLAHAMLF